MQLCAQAGNPEPAFDEYQVKAAFLYNFAKFVEWPAHTFAHPNDPIEICIVGQNPFGSALENMVQGKKVGDRSFTVQRLPDMQQAGKCQILFIGASEWKRTGALLDGVTRPGVLTVGEIDDFTALGGIIGFRLEGPRVRIRIDLQTAEQAKFRISSKLLSLAEIVKRSP
ncbi:MAG: YfiR family protein [Acidobacteriota bacterium]